MKFKGTEEDWKILNTDKSLGVNIGKKISLITFDVSEENKANFQLIASSPKMLKQLKKILNVLDIMFDRFEGELPDGIEEYLVPHMADIEDLIKEATDIK